MDKKMKVCKMLSTGADGTGEHNCGRNCKLEISTGPTKRSRGNQLIHRHLSKIKSLGSGSVPESQAGRQKVRRLWWVVLGVETGKLVGRSEIKTPSII